mmetsp:Transcript_33784/g.41616  ORF Transcript_33784/g.41616 Transcript_33784/m.41616 type:complete len:230 (+) Transcript_33784:53-742(+)
MDDTPSSSGRGTPTRKVYKKEVRRLPTWRDLESKKVNAACAMDRVEFLASTRNRFTEFRAFEANAMRQAIRSRSTPSIYMQRTLSSSAEGAADVLTKQNTMLTNAKTNALRLEALNKFIVEKEKHTGGKAQEQAALSFAKKSEPMVKPYPMYDELYNLPLRDPDKPREFPVSAVSCLLGYQPPKKALMHGMSRSGSGNNSLMNTYRSNVAGSAETEVAPGETAPLETAG